MKRKYTHSTILNNDAEIPKTLDEIEIKNKDFYVLVKCNSKDEVINIIKTFEKINIERERLTINV